LGAGVFRGTRELETLWQVERAFKPALGEDEVAHRRGRWQEALNRAREWEKPSH